MQTGLIQGREGSPISRSITCRSGTDSEWVIFYFTFGSHLPPHLRRIGLEANFWRIRTDWRKKGSPAFSSVYLADSGWVIFFYIFLFPLTTPFRADRGKSSTNSNLFAFLCTSLLTLTAVRFLIWHRSSFSLPPPSLLPTHRHHTALSYLAHTFVNAGKTPSSTQVAATQAQIW